MKASVNIHACVWPCAIIPEYPYGTVLVCPRSNIVCNSVFNDDIAERCTCASAAMCLRPPRGVTREEVMYLFITGGQYLFDVCCVIH